MEKEISGVKQINSYLIKINRPIAYMPLEMYIQYATKGPIGRFYVSRGASGGISISEKNVTILPCGIVFL